MLSHDLHQSVGFWLIMTARAYERALNDAIAPQGITYRQSQVLGWLAVDGPLPQTQLACRMRVEPPSLVDLLDRMEREGWIRRVPSPTDRRVKLIEPGPNAVPVWEQVLTCGRAVRAMATKGFTDEEKASLKDMLDRIQVNLAEAAESEQCDTETDTKTDTETEASQASTKPAATKVPATTSVENSEIQA